MLKPELIQAVYAVVCYYDLFDYPVTWLEVFKVVKVRTDLMSVKHALTNLHIQGKLESKFGHYFLPHRSSLVADKKRKLLIANEKYQKAKRIIRLLICFPFIRAIAISGSLAYSNAEIGSDIDLFVITKRRKVWTARFFVLFFLKIFRLRPTQEKKQDKICLSFLCDESHLALNTISHYTSGYHFPVWLSQFNFLFQTDEIFWLDNGWLVNHLPNFYPQRISQRRQINDTWLSLGLRRVSELALSSPVIEKWLRAYQLKVMPQVYQAQADNQQDVVLLQYMVKTHLSRQGRQYDNLLTHRLNQLRYEQT